MKGISEMDSYELRVHAGNVAYQIWTKMPEPKLEYTKWYYGAREQSLWEALEKRRLTDESAQSGSMPLLR